MVTKTKAAQKEKEKEEAPEKKVPRRPTRRCRCSISPMRPSRSSSAPPRSAATSPMTRSIRSCPPRRSIPSRSRTFSPCSARWVSTSSKPRKRPRKARSSARRPTRRRSEGGDLVEVQQKVPAKSEAKEPTERTDDPVRMYLREMGSVELLSREGEIAIAKRIEAGREAMIAGLCESPLTFQAIIIWRDELNEEGVPAGHHRPRSDLCRPRRQGHTGPGRARRPADPAAGRRGSGPGGLAQTRRPRRRPPAPLRSSRRPSVPTARKPRAARRRRVKAISTTTTWRIRFRSPRSSRARPRWSRPSTTSPMPTSACAACRTRTSRTSCATTRSPAQERARSSRTTSSPR